MALAGEAVATMEVIDPVVVVDGVCGGVCDGRGGGGGGAGGGGDSGGGGGCEVGDNGMAVVVKVMVMVMVMVIAVVAIVVVVIVVNSFGGVCVSVCGDLWWWKVSVDCNL
jgi:hypothetical protein